MSTQEKLWTVKELLLWITKKFEAQDFETPLLDAQLLLCHALKYKNRVELYINSESIVKNKYLIELRNYVKRRLSHEPVAYIMKQKYWYDLDLYIDSNVLTPRPETEVLVDFIIETTEQRSLNPEIIFDFCTGSGCLAIALAKKYQNAQVVAFDISQDVLKVAQKNALRNNVENIKFIHADILNDSTFEQCVTTYGKADIIVANPPYVSHSEWEQLSKDVKAYEPKIALVSNLDGLEFGQKLFDSVKKFDLLNTRSIFGMELSAGQPEILLQFQENIVKVELTAQTHEKPLNEWFILKDLQKKERFLVKICDQNFKINESVIDDAIS